MISSRPLRSELLRGVAPKLLTGTTIVWDEFYDTLHIKLSEKLLQPLVRDFSPDEQHDGLVHWRI